MAAEISDFPCDGTYLDPNDKNVTLRCPNRVSSRRPSASNAHFCADTRCQSAKQRFYRKHRVEKAKLAGADIVTALVTDIMAGQRSACAHCGHPDALVGWAHPNKAGLPCLALGPLGPGLPKGLLYIANPREDMEITPPGPR